VKMLLWIYST